MSMTHEQYEVRPIHMVALVLAIIGALNWGLVGLFQFDLIAALFGGPASSLSRVVYTVVGLAGLVLIATTTAVYARRRGPAMSLTP